MEKKRNEKSSYFGGSICLFALIAGMIAARNASEESVKVFLQKLTLYGPIITLLLFIVVISCGIYRTNQGKKNYDADTFQSGVSLLFSGAIGAIVSIVLIFIF